MISSELVFGLASIAFPIVLQGETHPYFTIFDKKFNELKAHKFIRSGLVIGVTNPLFTKVS